MNNREIKSTKTNIKVLPFNSEQLNTYLSEMNDSFVFIRNKSNFILDIYNHSYANNIQKHIQENQLIKSRVFNNQKEIKIFKKMNNWYICITADQQGNENATEYFDAEQIILGKDISNKDENLIHLKQMGQFITIGKNLLNHIPLNENKNALNNPLKLVTRNYIAPNEIGQYGISHTRMIKINF
jgi:CRISPR-associated protein (TIGR03984 family)